MEDAQRLTVLRLMLDLARILSAGILGQQRRATHADDLMLLAAVFIGQGEGRPMTAAKLAMYAGMARPTAIRKLQAFDQQGVVHLVDGRRYVLGAGIVNTPEADRAMREALRRVTLAAGVSTAIPLP